MYFFFPTLDLKNKNVNFFTLITFILLFFESEFEIFTECETKTFCQGMKQNMKDVTIND